MHWVTPPVSTLTCGSIAATLTKSREHDETKNKACITGHGNRLQSEHAGEMSSTRRISELLQNDNQQAPTTELPDQTAEKGNPVTFYIVPPLVEHK